MYSYQALCSTVNSFLEQLCVHLERDGQSATYVREILHSALPHMNCELFITLALLETISLYFTLLHIHGSIYNSRRYHVTYNIFYNICDDHVLLSML